MTCSLVVHLIDHFDLLSTIAHQPRGMKGDICPNTEELDLERPPHSCQHILVVVCG